MAQAYDVAILGAGYVGQALCRQALGRGIRCLAVARRAREELFLPEAADFHRRDLLGEDWSGLPRAAAAVVCFPLHRPGEAKAMAERLRERFDRALYCNTTGVYRESQGGEVDEESPVDEGHPRLPGERVLRSHGVTAVRVAGLYSASRNPLHWVERGLLQRSAAWLNLVHRDDLARALLELLGRGGLPPVLNCSDGRPLRRFELFDLYEELHSGKTAGPVEEAVESGKQVRSARLLDLLPAGFAFRDSLKAIREEWETAV